MNGKFEATFIDFDNFRVVGDRNTQSPHSIGFTAPEGNNQKIVSQTQDIYSMGMVIKSLWANESKLGLDIGLIDKMTTSMTSKNPETRPDVDYCLQQMEHLHFASPEQNETEKQRKFFNAIKWGNEAFINESMNEFQFKLALISDLPQGDKMLAQVGTIYLAEDGSYIVRDVNGQVQEGKLNSDFYVANLAENLDNVKILNEVLDCTSKAGHTKNINAQDAQGLTALHCAVIGGDVKVIEALLRNGANPNLLDNKKFAPINYVQFSHKNFEKVLEVLLKYGASPNTFEMEGKKFGGSTPFYNAVRNNASIETLALLLRKGAEVNRVSNSELFNSSSIIQNITFDKKISNDRKLEVINLLLEHDVVYSEDFFKNSNNDNNKTEIELFNNFLKDKKFVENIKQHDVSKNTCPILPQIVKLLTSFSQNEQSELAEESSPHMTKYINYITKLFSSLKISEKDDYAEIYKKFSKFTEQLPKHILSLQSLKVSNDQHTNDKINNHFFNMLTSAQSLVNIAKNLELDKPQQKNSLEENKGFFSFGRKF